MPSAHTGRMRWPAFCRTPLGSPSGGAAQCAHWAERAVPPPHQNRRGVHCTSACFTQLYFVDDARPCGREINKNPGLPVTGKAWFRLRYKSAFSSFRPQSAAGAASRVSAVTARLSFGSFKSAPQRLRMLFCFFYSMIAWPPKRLISSFKASAAS